MNSIAGLLPYVQILLSVLLILGVILQQSESGLGTAFGGGDNFSKAKHTKRGFEKFLFQSTIAIAILFVVSTFLALIIK